MPPGNGGLLRRHAGMTQQEVAQGNSGHHLLFLAEALWPVVDL